MCILKRILFVLSIIVTILSCNSNPLEAPLAPGRRDYAWTADTLQILSGEFATPISMWGSSVNDIWVSGLGSSNKYRLRHYDGNKWIDIDIGIPILDAFSVFGFSQSDVWIGTAHGVIVHFDGIKWTSYGNLSTSGEILVIQGMWGRNDSDLYAFGYLDKRDRTGYRGSILKHSVNGWVFLPVDTLSLNFRTMGYDKNSNKYFLQAYRSEDGTQFIYELNGSKLNKVFESHDETKIVNINGQVYFMVGPKIFRYGIGGLYVWNDFSSDPIYAALLNGRNEKDLFTINWGGIGHYNGKDLKTLYSTDLWFMDSALFEKDIFIASQNIQTKVNVILHGKLSN